MALLGRGALVLLHDIAKGAESDFHHWLSHEHFAERMGVPGFLRGRSYVALDAALGYCTLYEVREPAVLASKPYLGRLDDPTPGSRRAMESFSNTGRTACAVRRSAGFGVGAVLLTVELSPAPGAAAALEGWLADEVVDALSGQAGFTGAHLLRGDPAISRVATVEKRLRGGEDALLDRLLLVEGYDEDAVRDVMTQMLAPARLAERGAAPDARLGLYRLVHCVTAAELDAGP